MPAMQVPQAQESPTATKGSTVPTRSRWISIAQLLQALWALTLVGLSIYLLVLTRGKPADHADGLRLAATIIFVAGLSVAAGWYGLRKSEPWGWWLASACDWGIVATLVYATIDDATDGMLDWSMILTTFITMVVPVLLFFPKVRRHYLIERTRESSA